MSLLSRSGSSLINARAPKSPGLGSVAFSYPSAVMLTTGVTKWGISKLTEGSMITNPLFYKNAHSGYGKRGIDADKMGAGGLVQALHSKRRRA